MAYILFHEVRITCVSKKVVTPRSLSSMMQSALLSSMCKYGDLSHTIYDFSTQVLGRTILRLGVGRGMGGYEYTHLDRGYMVTYWYVYGCGFHTILYLADPQKVFEHIVEVVALPT